MGIFDFFKDKGKKAEDERNMSESLRKAVEQSGLGIQGFQVGFEDGTATLTGSAATQKDIELARLIVGNHKGVEKVVDDNLKLAPPPPQTAAPQQVAPPPGTPQPSYQAPSPTPAMPARMVTVQAGDTLSKLAKQYLGNANRYPEIFEANRPMIKDPDEIYPGQVLRIPQ